MGNGDHRLDDEDILDAFTVSIRPEARDRAGW